MSKIKILPEILSNKIAAGEVVERPASVVKELVENALDADSSRILIDVEKGGRSLIRVSDNGSGMSRDDALLALERYATSKIYKDQDLFCIHTLGFRGEALPSIAAVSRFTLVTRDANADSGIEICVDGGTIKKVAEVGVPKGTMVTIRQLFFNTPARRKFLKTIGTEMGHIADRIASIALGNPGVHFRLSHNDKIVKNWPKTSASFDRVTDVLGNDLKKNLHSLEFQNNGIAISGWISEPRVTRRTSRAIYIYVNGRLVRDRIIQHALFEGYSQRLVKGQFPVAAIFIKVPYDEVDVNVHPTKNEVRFAHQRDVHEAVRRAVAQTLYDVDRSAWTTAKSNENETFSQKGQVADTAPNDFGFRNLDFGKEKSEFGKHEIPFGARNVKDGVSEPATYDTHPTTRFTQSSVWPQKRFGDLRIIGQLHKTYIVCEAPEDLILIDQHAAHERILFEQFCARASDAQKPAQRLLMPETIELGHREAGVLEKLIPELKELGLDIEPFGGNTFVVKALPALLADRESRPLVIGIVEKIMEVGFSSGLVEVLEHCRMAMACHGAIRANQPLSDRQIKSLIQELDECRNPSHCPHGRPTWIRWELQSLEKSFKRVV